MGRVMGERVFPSCGLIANKNATFARCIAADMCAAEEMHYATTRPRRARETSCSIEKIVVKLVGNSF